jgi:hypothetical protein
VKGDLSQQTLLNTIINPAAKSVVFRALSPYHYDFKREMIIPSHSGEARLRRGQLWTERPKIGPRVSVIMSPVTTIRWTLAFAQCCPGYFLYRHTREGGYPEIELPSGLLLRSSQATANRSCHRVGSTLFRRS